MNLTILMPSLNEEESIVRTIESIPSGRLRDMGLDFEIVVVDGGSCDRTADLARSAGAEVINSGRGYGLQYRTGFDYARGEIIATADSDYSYPMEQIPELIGILLNEDLDFISTNRFTFMKKDSMARMNRFGNRVLTFFTNILFGYGLKDSQSGMWVFRKSILEGMKLTGNGMSLSQEIKIQAFQDFRAKEIGSDYRKRVGKVKLRKFADGFDNLVSLFRLRLNR